MNCLTHPELMDLLYGEGDRDRLIRMHRHLAECPSCLDAYLDLKGIHDWIQPRREPNQFPMPVLIPTPRSHRWTGWAAAAILALLLGASLIQQSRTSNNIRSLQARLATMDSRIAQAEYRMDENNRNQYYLLMALKDYADQHMFERRVRLEETR